MTQPKWKKARYSSGDYTIKAATSAPARWPGTQPLRALLSREREQQDTPRPTVLLSEAFTAVYLSMLAHGLTTYDAGALYRLVSHRMEEGMWNMLFGGGVKKLLKVSLPPPQRTRLVSDSDHEKKKRVNLHMKFLSGGNVTYQPQQQQQQTPVEPAVSEKPAYKEQFLPPETSIASFLMSKPSELEKLKEIDYDSDESLPSSDSEPEEEDDDKLGMDQPKVECCEHSDPNSYSWCLMRFAIVKLVLRNLERFLPIPGLDLTELPVLSPLVCSLLHTLERWQELYCVEKMLMFDGPPDNYIPNCFVDTSVPHDSPFINKYRAMLEPHNTPFKSRHKAALPIKRLWLSLIHQEALQDEFVRYIFRKRKEPFKASRSVVVPSESPSLPRTASTSRFYTQQPSPQQQQQQQQQQRSQGSTLVPSHTMPTLRRKISVPAMLSGGSHLISTGPTRKISLMSLSSAAYMGDSGVDVGDGHSHSHRLPMKIIHKEQDSITAFCINMVSHTTIAMATSKDLQELDISKILEQPSWLDDDTEYDILHLNRYAEVEINF
ncbi:PREDICTED: dmX-like protein 1 [Priapulus caudatus]|uniref:DmX-like protein 1 n=1 Tax=Priapulus caudatus TaxID=37621 RepID=A0ABM1ERN2_PRICU|nr:PREDICTED: dmX-like protein 1 [Priapulus caudatus]